MIQEAEEHPINFEIKIDFRDKKPVTEQIYAVLQHRIQEGLLLPGDRLPTVRQLASQLKINFNTVARAYRRLDHDGLITTRQGRGTFVLEAEIQEADESSVETGQDETSGTEATTLSPTTANFTAPETEAEAKTDPLARIAQLIFTEVQQAGVTISELVDYLQSQQEAPRKKFSREYKQRSWKKAPGKRISVHSPARSTASTEKKRFLHRAMKRTIRRASRHV